MNDIERYSIYTGKEKTRKDTDDEDYVMYMGKKVKIKDLKRR